MRNCESFVVDHLNNYVASALLLYVHVPVAFVSMKWIKMMFVYLLIMIVSATQSDHDHHGACGRHT